MNLVRILAVVVTILFAGCTSTTAHYTFLNSPPRRIHASDSAPLFTTGVPRDRHFVEIGLIEIRESNEFSSANTQVLMTAMRKEGGRRGCDGVVLAAPHEELVGMYVPYHGLRGTCIVFTD